MEGEEATASQTLRNHLSEDVYLLFEHNITNSEVKRNSLYPIIEHFHLQNNLQFEIVVDALFLAIEFCVSKKLNYAVTRILVQLILEEFEKLIGEDRTSLLPREDYVTSPESRMTDHMKGLSLEEDDDSILSQKNYPFEGVFSSDSYEKELQAWIIKFQSLYETYAAEIDSQAWKHVSGYLIQHILPDLPTYEYAFNNLPMVDTLGVSLSVVVDTPLNNLLSLQSLSTTT